MSVSGQPRDLRSMAGVIVQKNAIHLLNSGSPGCSSVGSNGPALLGRTTVLFIQIRRCT